MNTKIKTENNRNHKITKQKNVLINYCTCSSGISSDVSPSFKVSVYAAKTGCVNSDIETRVLDCNTGGLKGDVDGNGTVNAADHVKLSDIIMGK